MIMKSLTHRKLLKTACAGVAGLVLSAASALAQAFHVEINTSALSSPTGGAAAPFSLDFQLNSGDTLNNNTAVISNFTFDGGAPLGSATFIGGASGSLSGVVTLADSGAFNEFFQSFTSGSTIGFDVFVSQNTDAGATPDGFHFGIIDGSLFSITTTGFADQLLSVNLPGALPAIQTFAGTGDYAGITVTVTAIPEPSSAAAFAALAGLALAASRRRRA